MKLLLYCTKAKSVLTSEKDLFSNKITYFCENNSSGRYKDNYCEKEYIRPVLNGKIVAECDFEVHKFKTLNRTIEDYKKFNRNDMLYIFERSNLSYTELIDYLGENSIGYAIHIKNLHIFDKPINIRNYYNIAPKTMQDCMNQRVLVKAPQNMCNAYDVYKNHYVLISIRPEWLCKILNGEKTIEVRKKVLKEMLK